MIECELGRPVHVTFLLPDKDLELADPPAPDKVAEAINKYCCRKGIHLVFLDGPQGWKDPDSTHAYRNCEKELNTPGKTGPMGQVKPRNYEPFVKFSISVFASLMNLGADLVHDKLVEVPKERLLAVESFPLSAWRKLYISPLPAKRRARKEDLEGRLQLLRQVLGLRLQGEPNHDQLQALVSGTAGFGILLGNPYRYTADGVPPKTDDGTVFEGFIVNPLLPLDDSDR